MTEHRAEALALADLPSMDTTCLQDSAAGLRPRSEGPSHPPRILLLHVSVRERSYSRLAAEEAARILRSMGAETRAFDPRSLPLPDDAPETHPKVEELRELASWCEGTVWISPERHGAMTGIKKAQIDWIPLSLDAMRPTQGETLALIQVSGGSQSFNAVNPLRVLGRWMRMITIPKQSSVTKPERPLRPACLRVEPDAPAWRSRRFGPSPLCRQFRATSECMVARPRKQT